MEFSAYNLDGYMELDGKEFIEENLDTLTSLGGRDAYIFPSANLNDLADAVGAERGEDIPSDDEIIDKHLLRYIGVVAHKQDLIDALLNAGRFISHRASVNRVRETFQQALEEGVLTKAHIYDIISDAGNISSYLTAIRDMIERKVDFPIANTGGRFFWSSPERKSPATMRITDINKRNRLTFVTNTPVYSADGTIFLEYADIPYFGSIVADRAGRVRAINVHNRLLNHPMFDLSFSVSNIDDIVMSHIIAMNMDMMPDVSPDLRNLIALYV